LGPISSGPICRPSFVGAYFGRSYISANPCDFKQIVHKLWIVNKILHKMAFSAYFIHDLIIVKNKKNEVSQGTLSEKKKMCSFKKF
jgi:hypothetical protein